eukprot:5107889-Pyramimonas_sp.AAC.2
MAAPLENVHVLPYYKEEERDLPKVGTDVPTPFTNKRTTGKRFTQPSLRAGGVRGDPAPAIAAL